MEYFYTLLVIVVVAVVFIMATYNNLIKLRTRVEEAWSDIGVQLKYRADLIPNLVNTVKGYASHEDSVFSKVTEARASVMSASGPAQTAQAENQMQSALKSLFAIAENYPELKANTNFLDLQQKLTDTEEKIQGSRRFYNAGVRDLNTKIQTFPANIVASVFKFGQKEFFEVENRAEIENAPKVDFKN